MEPYQSFKNDMKSGHVLWDLLQLIQLVRRSPFSGSLNSKHAIRRVRIYKRFMMHYWAKWDVCPPMQDTPESKTSPPPPKRSSLCNIISKAWYIIYMYIYFVVYIYLFMLSMFRSWQRKKHTFYLVSKFLVTSEGQSWNWPLGNQPGDSTVTNVLKLLQHCWITSALATSLRAQRC